MGWCSGTWRGERLAKSFMAAVASIAFSPDGKTLALAFSGGVVLWDVARRERLGDKPLIVSENNVNSVAISLDGKLLAVGFSGDNDGSGGGVVLWDVVRRERLGDEPLPSRKAT